MVKAAVVTAASVFVQKYELPEQTINDALAIVTCGDARAFIDRMSAQLPKYED